MSQANKHIFEGYCGCVQRKIYRNHRLGLCEKCHKDQGCPDSDLDHSCDVGGLSAPAQSTKTVYADNIYHDLEIRSAIDALHSKFDKVIDIARREEINDFYEENLRKREEAIEEKKLLLANRDVELRVLADEIKHTHDEQVAARKETIDGVVAEAVESLEKIDKLKELSTSMTATQVKKITELLTQTEEKPLEKVCEVISKIEIPTEEEIKRQKAAEHEQAKKDLARNRLYQPTIASSARASTNTNPAFQTLKPLPATRKSTKKT